MNYSNATTQIYSTVAQTNKFQWDQVFFADQLNKMRNLK